MCSTVPEEALDALSDGELLEHVRGLVAEQNRVAARLARAVRAAECRQAAEYDGLKSMKSWLRTHTRVSGAAIGGIVRQGRAVAQLPAVERAFAAGAITGDQVEVIAEIVKPDNLDRAVAQDIDLTVVEQAFASIATTQPHQKLQSAVGTYLARLDPDGTEPDPTEERSLVLVQHPDGAFTGGLTLDQVGGEKVATALEAVAAASRCAGDTRTRAQRLADGLVQLCDLALASGELPVLRTVKPHVVVTIDHEALADPAPGHGAAGTGMGATLSAAKARWLACDGSVTRIVMGPDNRPLDLGRSHRVVPPYLRRALDVRDKGCMFAGCQAPTWWCEAQLLEWVEGGETEPDNLGLLCERHHTKVHHGFRIERHPDGRWRTWRPDGTEILLPAPLAA